MPRTPHDLKRRLLVQGALALPLATAMNRAFAQQTAGWPDRPIKVVLGYPPGGAADGAARPLEPRLQASLGQPILFDYRPGAGATVAAAFTAKAAPDGYTLHLTDSGPMTILPGGKRLPYDAFESFTPIGMVCSGGTLLVAHPSVAARNVPELVALLKAKPGMTYGTSGVGGAGHLAAELLQAMAGVSMTHVPYKGGSQAVTDLVGGQVPLLFSSMATAIPFVQGGKINALAVTSSTRASALPDVSTVAEQGLAGFEASVWFAMVGPARLPADIVARVNAAQNAALADPAVQAAIRKQGYEPQPGSPADLARQIRLDSDKWGKVIRDAKIAFD
jgi:tripartite-type tricarboxylate transporter receptor subunit TctC